MKKSTETIGLVGCGVRGINSYLVEATEFGLAERIAAICDANSVRLGIAGEKLGRKVEMFTDYDEFLKKSLVATVIIATPDYLHCEMAEKAFAAGKHVITEKPMAINVAQCDRMIAASRKAGRRLKVTYNLRYRPDIVAAKKLISEGIIGDVITMQAEDFRNIGHGADYFRRWHRKQECSGGLLVTKGCHTFDALNWLADSRPVSVYATGSRRFFGGGEKAGKRCKGCDKKDVCCMYVDIDGPIPASLWANDGFLKQMYSEAEHVDGYLRDQCVFGEEIDVDDNVQIIVRYGNGIVLTYSSLMFSPYKVRSFELTGTNGKLEINRRGAWLYPLFRGNIAARQQILFDGSALPPEEIDPVAVLGERGKGKGRHGGADGWMLENLFSSREDDFSAAGAREGRNAILIAESAYRSIERGEIIDVAKEFGR